MSFPDTPGWSYSVTEVSANVYKVVGRDRDGRTVEAVGAELHDLVEKCREFAKSFEGRA